MADFPTQTPQRTRELVWVWAGVIGALFACWLASATVIYACWRAAQFLIYRFGAASFLAGTFWQSADPQVWMSRLLVPSWMVCGLLIGYFMGLICAFFWHRLSNKYTEPQVLLGTRWACWILLVAHLPLLLNGFSVFLTLLSFPWMILPMWKGLENGLDWWPKREWRHLFDLANPWEREQTDR